MTDRRARPIRRALITVYDKTGLEELAAALRDAGVAIVSTGSTAAARSPASGVAGHPGRGADRVPECLDGRVKTLHPRVHAGLLADLRLESHRAQLADLRHRAVRPRGDRTSTRSPRRSRPGAIADECIEQIDIGGPSMVRAAAKNHPSVAIVIVAGAVRACSRRSTAGGFTLARAAAARRRGLRAHGVVRRRGRRVVRAGGRDRPRATGWPEFAGQTLATRRPCCATARTPHQRAALYVDPARSPASRRPSSCTARRCRTTTTSTPTRPGARRTTSRSRRSRSSSTRTRAASRSARDVADAHRKAHACDPVSAFGGVIATNRPVTAAMAEQVAEIFTEVIVAPDVRRRGARHAARQEEPAGPVAAARRRRAPASRCARSAAACCCSTPTGSRRDGDDPADWTLVAGEPAGPRTAWPTWRSPGGPAGRSSRTRSCWRPTARRSASAWARSTGSTPARLAVAARGRPGRGLGRRVRRLLPVPRRPEVLTRRRRARRRAARRLHARRRRHRRRRRGRRHDVLHRHPPLRPLTSAERLARLRA